MDRELEVVTVTLNPAIDQTISIPNFKIGEVNRVSFFQSDAGGKGINVAAALADYGIKAAVTGFLACENDQIFHQLFSQKNIVNKFVSIEGSTRVGLKIFDPEIEQTTDINFPGQAATPQDLAALEQTLESLAPASGWFVLSGSIPASMPPIIYRGMIKKLKQAGHKVLLDTSGVPLQAALPAGPNIIKPNVEELSDFFGRKIESDQEIIEASNQLMREYDIRTVAVSMGKNGAIFLEGSECVRAIPGEVELKSSVGAGDAMVAGIVAGKVGGLSLPETARLATAFSMGAISRLGSGLPSKEVLEDLKRLVTVQDMTA
ncbi:MAG: 1-phosphofructokinase [Chloroflexi bacterium]|jgi:1-phosphofructokinase|nr:1-phosphofructokinase [Chloroflexota bacterium]